MSQPVSRTAESSRSPASIRAVSCAQCKFTGSAYIGPVVLSLLRSNFAGSVPAVPAVRPSHPPCERVVADRLHVLQDPKLGRALPVRRVG